MSIKKKIKTVATAQAINQIVKLLPKVSDKNIIRMLKIAEKITSGQNQEIATGLRVRFEKQHPSIGLARHILGGLSKNCRDKLVQNFFINAGITGMQKRADFKQNTGVMPPFLLVISPSFRCNIVPPCEGCYAGNYKKEDDLPIDVLDRVLSEAKEMGIYFITISGGEPFIRKEILDVFEKHNDMYFQVYTNAQMINESVAKRLSELGNVAPAISVEGFETETDKRRGKGVYENVIKAMSYLKQNGVLFGFSATVTRNNSELLSSNEFIDYYIKQGCCFGWYFQYIPIGKSPNVELMSTPEQRFALMKRVRVIREEKPIFVGDFWNDGEYVNGCMAGGRNYLHITCNGDVEPCVFVHFAVDNIKTKSLKEAVTSDFFKAIRNAQPYCKNKNLLVPCMIIDHPHVLRGIIDKFKAYPTHPGSETIVKDSKITNFLDCYSAKYRSMADPVWERDYMNNPKSKWHKDKEAYKKIGAH